jgi:hypothetical protein
MAETDVSHPYPTLPQLHSRPRRERRWTTDLLDALQDSKQAEDEEHQSGPFDKLVVVDPRTRLVHKHGKEVKGDDGGSGGVSFPGGEGVGGSGGFEEDCAGGCSRDLQEK